MFLKETDMYLMMYVSGNKGYFQGYDMRFFQVGGAVMSGQNQ